ncbi:hypothetical protein RRG44_00555 [Mycoplasmopsis cynos]|uniref:hypothetical protein n=1 Tax=Mycoplasmopsis cynos TaxID=171284 RepID=UPI0021FEBF9C|nr:hypothetical protein [Mycoplasmopsis cynos]UWV92994.1 hypothetical protein NWE57_03200 [Mycoplasmopsis cynos]WAM04594.1 hypothetical protein ONA01_06440 [Mycoplasmopsis cynos]WQQ15419.1 hypothetical protein RRG43_03690 [Mycoplasmopsis cynos]WQQ16435.1 hypothetical protein RRG51_01545 [Mycoplasmopsis cynos]WQQ19311.1 hypothetical protein RRG44_00555 [Mycoplasmopsis cynos]
MILNIALYTLAGILGIILLVVLGWRIYEYITKKSPSATNQNRYTTKKTEDKLFILSSMNDSVILSNILVKNKFAKQGFSVLNGIIVTNEKIFIVTNLITTFEQYTIEINFDSITLIKPNQKIKSNFYNTKWLSEIEKYMQKKFNEPFEIIILIDEKNKDNKLINKTSYRVLNIEQIDQEIKTQKNAILNIKNISEFFLNNNLMKNKTNV